MQTQPSTPTIIINGIPHTAQCHSPDIQSTINIMIAPNTLLPNQPTPTICTELNTHGYSGLLGLLQNAHLLALHEHNTKLHPRTASYLQSCLETTANTLGDGFHALCALQSPENSHFITPALLADYGAMMGELLPYFTLLASELAAAAEKS